MRWAGRRGSSNIEDRRGTRFRGAGGIGLGTIVLALVALYFGQDPSVVLQNVQPVIPERGVEENRDMPDPEGGRVQRPCGERRRKRIPSA